MTQLEKDPTELPNYFDELLRGIGHRGSSFGDLDFFRGRLRLRVTHDGQTHRFIAQEFKYWHQLPLNHAQAWMLYDLAHVAEFTVWLVAKRDDGRIGWLDCRHLSEDYMKQIRIISEATYQRIFRLWWNRELYENAATEIEEDAQPPLDHEMRWK